MNYDNYECPICGLSLVDHLGMCGICPTHGLFTLDDLKKQQESIKDRE